MRDHLGIIAALEARDPDLSERLLGEHVISGPQSRPRPLGRGDRTGRSSVRTTFTTWRRTMAARLWKTAIGGLLLTLSLVPAQAAEVTIRWGDVVSGSHPRREDDRAHRGG